ncbi:MAG: ABC transporter substrate-binding protein, partial [Methyloprofundus sp.]|nr:ABC transporter substrate-binding protein [Methyloprofundus sp.]
MKTAYTFILLIIFIALLWFMEHKDKPHIKPSGNSVKIGMIGPFSGANTYKGELGTKGIEVAQQLIPYLDNGDSIEWIREDDHGIPEYSVSALKTLVETHKVAAIIILSGSDSVLAVAKVAEQYKTPILTLFASHPDITRYSSLVNQFNFDDTFQAAVAALYIRDELLIDEVAMLTQSGNAHFTYLANEFAKQFTATEGIITDRYELKEDEQNYLPILQSIKNKDPELLYLPIAMEHIFEVKSALIQLNWNPKIMLSDGILANIKVQKKYPVERMNGMMAIDAYSYDM